MATVLDFAGPEHRMLIGSYNRKFQANCLQVGLDAGIQIVSSGLSVSRCTVLSSVYLCRTGRFSPCDRQGGPGCCCQLVTPLVSTKVPRYSLTGRHRWHISAWKQGWGAEERWLQNKNGVMSPKEAFRGLNRCLIHNAASFFIHMQRKTNFLWKASKDDYIFKWTVTFLKKEKYKGKLVSLLKFP